MEEAQTVQSPGGRRCSSSTATFGEFQKEGAGGDAETGAGDRLNLLV